MPRDLFRPPFVEGPQQTALSSVELPDPSQPASAAQFGLSESAPVALPALSEPVSAALFDPSELVSEHEVVLEIVRSLYGVLDSQTEARSHI